MNQKNKMKKRLYLNPFIALFKTKSQPHFLQSNVRQRHEEENIVLKDFVLESSRKAHKKKPITIAGICVCKKFPRMKKN